MPDPDDPDPGQWAAVTTAELGMLTAGADGGPTVVIAHSLSTVLWAHLAQTLPATLLPSRVALVSPGTRPEWAKVAPKVADVSLGSLTAVPTVIVGRTEDPARMVPLSELAAAWGAPFVEIPGVGHLSPSDGHGPFPGALAWALGGPPESWLGEAFLN